MIHLPPIYNPADAKVIGKHRGWPIVAGSVMGHKGRHYYAVAKDPLGAGRDIPEWFPTDLHSDYRLTAKGAEAEVCEMLDKELRHEPPNPEEK